MKQTLTWIMLPLLMLASLPAAQAGPPSNRIKQGPGLINEYFPDAPGVTEDNSADKAAPAQTTNQSAATAGSGFDGVWHDAGHVLLVKQIHDTLYLSGSSDDAAWQAQCVTSAALARCLGKGISKTGGEFSYGSDLHLAEDRLHIDWQRHYRNGRSDSGKVVAQR